VVSTVVFTIFFGRLANIPSDGIPYSLFVLSGLVYWNYFSSSLSKISESIVGNEGIIKKVYFPRILLPISALLTSVVDFLIGIIILVIYAFIIGVPPTWNAFYVFPLAMIFTAFSAIGIGLIFASINVVYRDIRYAIPFVTQILIFLTPVIYPLSIVGSKNRNLMAINPMTTVINFVRSVFPNTNSTANYTLAAISVSVALVLMVVGFAYFKRIEHIFADIT
jgi:lipopolysaccharide transport system permease protein